MSILLYFDVSIIGSFVITFCILLLFNYTIGFILMSLQRKALDSDCDPEKFLRMLDNQEKRRGKEQKVIHRLAVNRAAAYIALGNIDTAKEYLDGVDSSYLSEKDGSFLIYTINLIICLYELGELEKAEILYETNLIKLCPIGKRLQKSVEILIGERYYFLEKYNLCYENLSKLKNCNLDKRQYLGILYRLSQIDIQRGDIEQAVKKLNKIKKFGNKLGIAKSSREILDNLKLQAK